MWLHGEVIKRVAFRVDSALEVIVGGFNFPHYKVTCKGSYRRGKEECEDINIIVTHTKSKAPVGVLHALGLSYKLKSSNLLVDELKKLKYLTDDLEITGKDARYDWNHHFDK